MSIFSNINYHEYIPSISENGMFQEQEPMIYDGIEINEDLVEIISLLKPEITGKLCTILDEPMLIPEDNEIFMKYLPKTNIKMIVIINNSNYYHYSNNRRVARKKSSKEYIFYLSSENEDYANIIYLLQTHRLSQFLPRSETRDIKSFNQILYGICLGYPIENIKGFYLKANTKYGFFYYPSMNVKMTSDEEDLFNRELNDFIESDEYKELTNDFYNDLSRSFDLINRLKDMNEFRILVEENRTKTFKCEPEYLLSLN